MPEGYPSMADLQAAGWFPVPQGPLPFPSLVLTSDDDPLAERARVEALARSWRSRLLHLGAVGHLNPASGFGPWPQAKELVAALAADPLALGT